MTRLCIVADDLTGACDTGACFAQRGLVTMVALRPGLDLTNLSRAAPDVLVLSTESRYLPVDDAVQAIGVAADTVLRASGDFTDGGARVYKKIDSVLRGHPGAELAALMVGLHIDRALVVPAFPAQGRTTADGTQYVRGKPLEQTVFAGEVTSGDLRIVFAQPHGGVRICYVALSDIRRGHAHLCEALNQAGPCVFVADAETDVDLAALTRAALQCGIRLWCGSAGLATALAGRLEVTPARSARADLKQNTGAVLAVAGSQHPATMRQIDAARELGMAVLQAPLEFVQTDLPGAVTQLVESAAACLAQGDDVILTTTGMPDSPLGKHWIAKRLGAVASQLLTRAAVAGLVLTGGDIAAAVCAALGAQVLELDGEVQPGIAIGRLFDGARPGLTVVTKAGGFGDDQALVFAIGAIYGRR
jgi:uncharacterized protein YgbK (DUF1537 family)